jgi:hypothetical protein
MQRLLIDARPAPAQAGERRSNIWLALVRHFWGNILEVESLSPNADPAARIAQVLGILAAPAAFLVIFCLPLDMDGWHFVVLRSLFVSFSMIAMAFVTVLHWGALFPDRRDYLVLTPLPVPAAAIFTAKAAALALFLAVFLLDINLFAGLIWPSLEERPELARIWLAHGTAVLGSGLFGALAAASLQGILICAFPEKALRRISTWIQTLLMGSLIMLLCLIPVIGMWLPGLVASRRPVLSWAPMYWFVGLYERMLPAVGDPGLIALGDYAVHALAWAAVVFVATYLVGYGRHARRVLESPELNPEASHAWRKTVARVVDRLLLPDPLQRAVFHFTTQTIARSMRHRILLACYGGFGAALAVMHVVLNGTGARGLPLILSFILVAGLRAIFHLPAELPANWVFQIAATESVRPARQAVRKWMILCAILPLFILLAPLEVAIAGGRTACLSLACGITASVVLMETAFSGFRKIPFTCAYCPAKVNMVALIAVYIVGFTAYVRLAYQLQSWLLERPAVAWGVLLSIAAVYLVSVNLGLRPDAPPDYEGAADPVVRTLGLAPQ